MLTHIYCACFKGRVTCRASHLVSMDFRTLCFCRPEGLAFSAVTIFQIGANMYKAFGGFAKFDRRYSPMTPRDSNNLKAKERNHVDCVAFEGQLFVDLMILYLGSRHLFVRTRFVRFLWLGFGSLLVPGRSSRWTFRFRCFNHNAQSLVQKTQRTAEGKGYKGKNGRTKYSHHEVKIIQYIQKTPMTMCKCGKQHLG